MLWAMAGLFTHLVVYAAVNAFLIAVWVLMGSGDIATLRAIAAEPTSALDRSFWPIWSILGWGVVLVIHAGFAVPGATPRGRRRRRRRRTEARGAARSAKEMAKEAVSAIDAAHEDRMEKRAAAPPPSGPERRWVTVMFCDIAGSTSHNERLGDEEWHRVLAHVRGVVRSALTQRGGGEVGTQGDGMLSRFATPADAVLCGIDIQTELGAARQESGFVPELRIGVHAGEAVDDEGDLIGRVINLASRVTDEAAPGEILVTEPVADQLVGKLELEDKGLRPLKGVQQPRHLLAVRWSQT